MLWSQHDFLDHRSARQSGNRLKRAREIGSRTLDGGGMAVFQAAGSFELFTGVEPDRERMLRHFAELTAVPVGGTR